MRYRLSSARNLLNERLSKYVGAVTRVVNGSLYGVPDQARQEVIKFDPVDKSFTYIGPDSGDGNKKQETSGIEVP